MLVFACYLRGQFCVSFSEARSSPSHHFSCFLGCFHLDFRLAWEIISYIPVLRLVNSLTSRLYIYICVGTVCHRRSARKRSSPGFTGVLNPRLQTEDYSPRHLRFKRPQLSQFPASKMTFLCHRLSRVCRWRLHPTLIQNRLGTRGVAIREFIYGTMPLHESKTKPRSWEDIKEQFAIFYASKGEDGTMWCPVRSSCGIQVGFLDKGLIPGLPCGQGDC